MKNKILTLLLITSLTITAGSISAGATAGITDIDEEQIEAEDYEEDYEDEETEDYEDDSENENYEEDSEYKEDTEYEEDTEDEYEEDEEYETLDWDENEIMGYGEKGKYDGKKVSVCEFTYLIEVDKLSDITFDFKGNKNVTVDANIQLSLLDDDLQTAVLNDNLTSAYSDGKRTYKFTYKSIPKGTYIVDVSLVGKKNKIDKKLGGTLTLSKKKAYVGQVTEVNVQKLKNDKCKISWNKANKAKKYQYYFVDSSLKASEITTVASSKRSLTYTAKDYQSMYIRAVNGKHKSAWKMIPVGDYVE